MQQGSSSECFECDRTAHHKHHVVPQVHGGTKTVWLCAGCHGLAHSHNMPLPALIKAGIAKARAAGNGKWGVPRSMPYEEIEMLYEKGMSGSDIARLLGVKSNSVYNCLRKIKLKNKA